MLIVSIENKSSQSSQHSYQMQDFPICNPFLQKPLQMLQRLPSYDKQSPTARQRPPVKVTNQAHLSLHTNVLAGLAGVHLSSRLEYISFA